MPYQKRNDMMTNRKFENAAALRSRIALLVALVVHIALIGFLVLRSENSSGISAKTKEPINPAQPRP
ncbi:MAG: hypothetical protein IPM82_17285 [Saprospiraceae bacterium]|nr:hypothetical protein [Saprospiraceae bacterium]